MTRRSRSEPPYLVIAGPAGSRLVHAAAAGVEEEGVPWTVASPRGDDPVSCAHEAAGQAPLEVALAVVGDRMCLTHATLTPPTVVEVVDDADEADARRLGHNAARIVVGLPLREPPVAP